MSLYSKENNNNNVPKTTLPKDLKNIKSHELSIIVNNFVSSLFQEALYDIKNKEIEKNKIVSKFISSIFDEIKIGIIASNFVNSVFEIVKKKSNNKVNEMDNPINSNQNKINKRIPNLINTRKVINGNNCPKDELNSSLKKRKVHFNISCDSNSSTFFKSDKKCETNNTKSSFKNKKNYHSSQNKNNKINNFDCHKYKLSKESIEKREMFKEKDKYVKQINIINRHISAMKKIQEEINKKLILFKNKGDTINRIRKEKTIPKRGITSVLENQREEHLKKPKSIEKKKQIENVVAKRALDKIKFEKKNKYIQIKGKNNKLFGDKKIVNKQNNINVKNIIEKIRILREFNKNVVPQKKKIFPKKNSFKNALQYQNNFIISQFLKIQLEQLQNTEKEYLNKQIITK